MTDQRVLAELKRRYPEYDDSAIARAAGGSLLAATLTLQFAVRDLVEPVAAALTRVLTRH